MSLFVFPVIIYVIGLVTVLVLPVPIISALRGKKIAVLGARAVGKTTILKYMEKGILIEQYKQTLAPEAIEKTRIKLGDLDIILKKTTDVSGSESAYAGWKKLFDESDIILYIVRTNQLLKSDPDTTKRCEKDLKQIKLWIKESQKQKQFFIVGNHWNDDPEYKKITDETRGDYDDRFKALPVVKTMIQLAGGLATVKVALGSLATKEDAGLLVKRIFEQVKE